MADLIERHKGVPLDGAVAFAEGFRLPANPYKTMHMRAIWREQFMLAEANEGESREKSVAVRVSNAGRDDHGL